MVKMLIDSGPLIALFDKDSKYHSWAINLIRENNRELITTIATIHEVLQALAFSDGAQRDFLSWVEKGAVTVAPVSEDDITRLWEITTQHEGRVLDLADATLVVLAEKYGIDKVATLSTLK